MEGICQVEKTVDGFLHRLGYHLFCMRGSSPESASRQDGYTTLCYAVRDHIMDRWRRTTRIHYQANPKFVYYLSAEYLLGRQLGQNMLYTGTTELAREALAKVRVNLDRLQEQEVEPGLGNGGLGRLAACFIDSLATLDIPAVGYGIRYEYGIFRQLFQDGWQVEAPDEWLYLGYPWDFPQPDDMVPVGFGGRTEHGSDPQGRFRVKWVPQQQVMGEPCHLMVPGWSTGTVNMLRLWRARATKEFDFQLFDVGDYAQAVKEKVISETITKVLYPNDSSPQGRRLRLGQQYFFVACSLKDIIRRFRIGNRAWEQFPDKAVIQLNDTHPVIAIPELMRILVDEEGLEWEAAWDITVRVFAYTNHTLLPEALEKWPVDLFGEMLPRHLEIVYEINRRFLEEVRNRYPGDEERVRRMSIIEEHPVKSVRMAYLATVGSFSVNGVASLQSQLLREQVLRDFWELWPGKFNNKTNGVTPRRFMKLANPGLSALIDSRIGSDWLRQTERLRELEPLAGDPDFRQAWRQVKLENKRRLAGHIQKELGLEVNPEALFDVMVKRLHEYKRQLLKTLHIITLYHRLKDNPAAETVPRVFIFGAKAAPGYRTAKLIIKLINSVAGVVNADPDVAGRIKVVFLPNFNVTQGELVYPAADVSEQISLAGKEASGTGNMKFALNGALTVGTLDGANIEIQEHVGPENFFLFGLTAEEVFALKRRGHDPRGYYEGDLELRRAIDAIGAGAFSGGDAGLFSPLVESLLGHDEYLLLADYRSYVDCAERAAEAFRDSEAWTRKSILNVARCGYFSSDRTIREYCREIWRVDPVPVPLPE